MKDERVVTVPVVNRKRLEGVLTVSDITDSFMEAYDSEILSTAHTRYCNIVDTLEGTLLIGDVTTRSSFMMRHAVFNEIFL